MSGWMAALLGVVCGGGPVLALGIIMDRAGERAHRRRMAEMDERSAAYIAELEARAFTAPNGKRYVTWDRERSRAQILTRPQ